VHALDQIINGECLAGMKDIDDQSIDLILSDLPYAVTQNEWDSLIPLGEMWAAFKRIIKPGAPIVLTCSQPFTTKLAASNVKWLKTEWIWRKSNLSGFLNAKKYPLKSHENILVFCEGLPLYNPQMTPGKPYTTRRKSVATPNYRKSLPVVDTVNTSGDRYPTSVLEFNSERGLHPTQKPVTLFEYLIRTYSNPGAVVFDPCMGSGTTAIAAIRSDRHFLGFERDAEYHAIAIKRIEDERNSRITLFDNLNTAVANEESILAQ
jgi:site-specific DNA-methyltransferase (adenine-specific)